MLRSADKFHAYSQPPVEHTNTQPFLDRQGRETSELQYRQRHELRHHERQRQYLERPERQYHERQRQHHERQSQEDRQYKEVFPRHDSELLPTPVRVGMPQCPMNQNTGTGRDVLRQQYQQCEDAVRTLAEETREEVSQREREVERLQRELAARSESASRQKESILEEENLRLLEELNRMYMLRHEDSVELQNLVQDRKAVYGQLRALEEGSEDRLQRLTKQLEAEHTRRTDSDKRVLLLEQAVEEQKLRLDALAAGAASAQTQVHGALQAARATQRGLCVVAKPLSPRLPTRAEQDGTYGEDTRRPHEWLAAHPAATSTISRTANPLPSDHSRQPDHSRLPSSGICNPYTHEQFFHHSQAHTPTRGSCDWPFKQHPAISCNTSVGGSSVASDRSEESTNRERQRAAKRKHTDKMAARLHEEIERTTTLLACALDGYALEDGRAPNWEQVV